MYFISDSLVYPGGHLKIFITGAPQRTALAPFRFTLCTLQSNSGLYKWSQENGFILLPQSF